MSEIPSIGDVVRQWRSFHKLNVTEFAKRAGLSKGYVSELENNKIDNPTPPNLEKLAAAIGISVLDLLARRMPGEVDALRTAVDQPQPVVPSPGEDDDFTFSAPVRMPPQHSNETKQLHQLLARVDELRAIVVALIAEKEQGHGR